MLPAPRTPSPTPAAQPDAQALQTLRKRLLRHARFAMASPAAAEDLVQDTLLVVIEAAVNRRGESSLATWAMAVLKHKIADWYRAPARRVMVSLEPDDETLAADVGAQFDSQGRWTEPVSPWAEPEAQEERRQMVHALDLCMTHLPGQTGRVFVMREWLGFETAEIAERLGLSTGNIRQILHRARLGLRLCMQQHWHRPGAPS